MANDIPALLRPLAMSNDGDDAFASPFVVHSEAPAQSQAFNPSERDQTEDAIAWANLARQAAEKSDEDGDVAWDGIKASSSSKQAAADASRSDYEDRY